MVNHGGGLVFRAFHSVMLQIWAWPQLKCSHWGEEHNWTSSDGEHDLSEAGMGKDISETGRMPEDRNALCTAKPRAGHVVHCPK